MNNVDFMRKYADIINEAQQPEQLNEGIIDTAKKYVSKLIKVLDPTTLKQIAATVKQATGGDYSLTRANAEKVAQALGAPSEARVSEEFEKKRPGAAISPTLGGKIAQALELGVIGGAIPLAPATGGVSLFIGILALMMLPETFGTEPGQIGSEYEKSGNALGHQEIRPKPGVTPTYANPGFSDNMTNT